MSFHNLLSKTARACAAYIVNADLAGVGQNVYPVKNSGDKQIGNGLVICDCLRWTSDPGNPGRYLVETRIVCQTPASPQPTDPAAPVERIASEEFVSQVFDLFFTDVVQQDNTQLADLITAAGQQLAATDPDNNGDMAYFKCDEIVFEGGSGDANEDGAFWEDVLNLTLFVRAVNVSED